MGEYTPEKIRNIALCGHGGTGKTSVAEAVMFSAGATNRLGSVDEGNTVSDYTDAEIARKISISTSLLHCDWKGAKVNILDAPGYADFIGDAKAAIWASDIAITLVNAASGVEIGTDKAFNFADEFNRATAFVINHVDREFADFDSALAAVQEHFGNGAIPFQIPVNAGEGFNQIIDALQMKSITYTNGKSEVSDIPAEWRDRAEALREQVVEGVAESDEDLIERYLEEGDLTDEEIARGVKIGMVNRTLFPVFASAASKNVGIDLLLDFLSDFAPGPLDLPLPTAHEPGTEEEVALGVSDGGALAAVVFKTISESVGDLSFLRVYSGRVQSGADAFNTNRRSNERIGQIYAMRGGQREDMDGVGAGDIGALIKLKNTHTGDTLCNKNRHLQIQPIEFPHPLIRVAVAPKARGDEDKIGAGLQSIHEEDPSFTAGYDSEVRQIIAEGQGELHLTVVFDKLKTKFGVEVDVVEPASRTARPSKGVPKRSIDTESKAVDAGNTARRICALPPSNAARASSLSTRSSAAPFPGNSFPRWRKASWRPCNAGCSPAIRSWIRRSRFTMGLSTRSTRPIWRLSWPVRLRFKTHSWTPNPFCWSRFTRCAWSFPKPIWAM